jgi:hypothetical protein
MENNTQNGMDNYQHTLEQLELFQTKRDYALMMEEQYLAKGRHKTAFMWGERAAIYEGEIEFWKNGLKNT